MSHKHNLYIADVHINLNKRDIFWTSYQFVFVLLMDVKFIKNREWT